MATSPPSIQDQVPSSLVRDDTLDRQRWFGLMIVLVVSFAHPIAASFYYLLGGTASADPLQHKYRLWASLLSEATSLALLWYVLSTQSRTWKHIGWNARWTDIPPAFGLLVVSAIAMYAAVLPVQLSYRAWTGHYLAPRSFHGLFGFGISVLSVAFICLNPFFEELIVRAYTMSEIMNLGGSRTVAILVSVVIQMSYHSYQGLLNGIALTTTFLVFSVYFSKTRRIGPVVLAHLCLDGYALLKGSF
jgi:membrane protease YdiL (CAAX protease family)